MKQQMLSIKQDQRDLRRENKISLKTQRLVKTLIMMHKQQIRIKITTLKPFLTTYKE